MSCTSLGKMKSSSMGVALLLFAVATSVAQQSDPKAESPAPTAPHPPEALPDAHWNPIQQMLLAIERPQTGLATSSPRGIVPYMAWEEYCRQLLRTLGLAFYDRFPADERRWAWLAAAVHYPPAYLKGAMTPAKGYSEADENFLLTYSFGYAVPDAAVDTEARNLWKSREEKLVAESQAAGDCPDDTKADIALWEMSWNYFYPRMADAPSAADVEQWRLRRQPLTQKLLDLLERHPTYAPHGSELKSLVAMMMDDVRKLAPAEYDEFVDALCESPNALVSRFAGGAAELEKLRKEPIQMQFTAVDGRKVDLAAMRGKVILIDYWGTWCDKCHYELPWLKDLYAKYHADGFEEAWSHYVTTFNDPYVLKYGITGAPTHLLLDKNGCLIEKFVGTWHPTMFEPVLKKALGR